MTALPVTIDDVRAARDRIRDALVLTPCLDSKTLSAITGAEVVLKFENLQFTASFKERGALNRLLLLDEGERRRGVIAMSAGNHAQGVAYHAARLGIPATIVMPKATPFTKIEQTSRLGARVMLEGDRLGAAEDFARALADREGLTFIHPYDDEAVIAGQGTVALEMLEAHPDLDVLLVPVGGGGLISGMAVAARAVRPDIEIIGVETELYPSMRQAILGAPAGGGTAGGAPTIAEGIAVGRPGKRTETMVRALVSEVMLVPESEIERAVLLLLEIEKTVAEGAGAAGLAALLVDPARGAGRKVGIVLSGGNIDSRLLSQIIMRGLVREGRLARITVEIPDVPGNLARVTGIIGDSGGNIVEVYHERAFTRVPVKTAVLVVVLETRNREHADTVLAALAEAGFTARGVELP